MNIALTWVICWVVSCPCCANWPSRPMLECKSLAICSWSSSPPVFVLNTFPNAWIIGFACAFALWVVFGGDALLAAMSPARPVQCLLSPHAFWLSHGTWKNGAFRLHNAPLLAKKWCQKKGYGIAHEIKRVSKKKGEGLGIKKYGIWWNRLLHYATTEVM